MLNLNSICFSVGNYEIKFNHIIVFSILLISFLISILLRIGPINYGWQLNEFDPFFNFRATQFIFENGILDYLQWNDELSWYPNGRDISLNSQTMLHIITAYSYYPFSNSLSLYDYTIIFPVIVGSLTIFIIFGITRNIIGTSAGLLSALFFSVSIPILVRGSAGWFKSEPLGLFLGLLGFWLFLSALNSKSLSRSIIKNIFSGIIIFVSLSAWGGNQFFIILLGLFIIYISFINRKNLIFSIPAFTISIILTSFLIERPGIGFIFGLNGLSIIFPTFLFIIITIFKTKIKKQMATNRNLLLILLILISFSLILLSISYTQFEENTSFRYLNALNPFLKTTDPLVDSISEHSTVDVSMSFIFHNVFLIFSGIGIWIILKKESQKYIKKEMIILCLIFGILGLFIGSSFSRLQVFTSLSLIILSSIGISILLSKNFVNPNFKKNKLKLTLIFGILFLFFIPLIISEVSPLYANDYPPTILTGAAQGNYYSNDWIETLEWIKNNTPDDSKIAAWWDYGYWIETIAERTTFIDNATLNSNRIIKIANSLLSSPEDGLDILQSMEADYFVLFIAGQKVPITGPNGQNLYVLDGGGDESKKYWVIKISDMPIDEFLYPDNVSATEKFWKQTLYGKLIPFSLIGYINPQNNAQYLTYVPGSIALYEKNIKLDRPEDPFKLVFVSSGFANETDGPMRMVLVYQLNKNFNN